MPKMPPPKSETQKSDNASSKGKTKPKAEASPKKKETRKVVYDVFEVKKCIGANALTEEQAKTLLGWQEETEAVAFDKNYLLTDFNGKKIRCLNNYHNRPFKMVRAKTWCSEHLHGNWKGMNGENLIIGKYGSTLSAQHRLIGFILACQEWRADPTKWPVWKKCPVMECTIAYGVEEDDATVNTIDTGDVRSLTDVIYRSEYFADLADTVREKVASVADKCIKTLRYRVGGDLNAHSPRQTHAMSLDFLERHPKILKCCRHIYESNANNALSKFIPLGIGSALMYLMATMESDSKAYREEQFPSEKTLNFDRMQQAEEFFINLAAGTKEFAAFRAEAQSLLDTAIFGNNEKTSLLINAWNCFAAKKPITKEALKLEFSTTDDLVKVLETKPIIGGIDLGDPKDNDDPDVEQAEVEASKSEVAAEKTAKNGKAVEFTKGDSVRVTDPKEPEGKWEGVIEEIINDAKKGKQAKVKATAPKTFAGRFFQVPYEHLSPLK